MAFKTTIKALESNFKCYQVFTHNAISVDVSSFRTDEFKTRAGPLESSLCFSFTPEMGMIEEHLQFEQRYISSVVEGMGEKHVICPMCHT